jgi:hypothetical protein
VDPAIVKILNRDGEVIAEPEKDLRPAGAIARSS